MEINNELKYFKFVRILSIIGVFLALYLLYGYVFKPAYQPCSINETINCDAVTKGEVSTFAEIPVPLIGLAGYVVILFSAVKKNKKIMLAMSLFGTLFCLRITFIEVFQLKVICPVCLACQIVMISILLLSFILIKDDKSKN